MLLHYATALENSVQRGEFPRLGAWERTAGWRGKGACCARRRGILHPWNAAASAEPR